MRLPEPEMVTEDIGGEEQGRTITVGVDRSEKARNESQFAGRGWVGNFLFHSAQEEPG